MLTFFTVPKPFQGHFDVIQRNAIASWKRIAPAHGSRILLFGDDHGVEAAARDLGVEHFPSVRRAPDGAPLLDGVFETAQASAPNDLFCFINCDIVLLSDFIDAARSVAQLTGPALMIGECVDLEIEHPLDFADPNFESALRAHGRARGRARGLFAIDYFLFTPGLYASIPPFAVGRARYDNWLVWKALRSRAAVINASDRVLAVHQRHDYAHLAGGLTESVRGPVARANQRLAGWRQFTHLHGMMDATHRFGPNGIEPRHERFVAVRQLVTRARLRMSGSLHTDAH